MQEANKKPVEKLYPRLFATEPAAAYLREYWGIERSASALAKDRVAGTGPTAIYIEDKPYYERVTLDAWVEARISETRPASLARQHERFGRYSQRRKSSIPANFDTFDTGKSDAPLVVTE
jgi:hypothetical protein